MGHLAVGIGLIRHIQKNEGDHLFDAESWKTVDQNKTASLEVFFFLIFFLFFIVIIEVIVIVIVEVVVFKIIIVIEVVFTFVVELIIIVVFNFFVGETFVREVIVVITTQARTYNRIGMFDPGEDRKPVFLCDFACFQSQNHDQ
jgi:hypothetical protein